MISRRNLFLFASLLFATLHAHALTFSKDVPIKVQIQMTEDLQLVSQMQGNGSTNIFSNLFGGNLDGKNLSQFFSSRIKSVDTDSCGGGPGTACCVYPKIKNKMFLTPNYTDLPLPQIYRISLLFHESRHVDRENQNWAHVVCPTPYRDAQGQDIRALISQVLLQGLDACDNTPYGAYGLQAELLKNVQYNCVNCSEKIKMDAKLFGDDTLNRISDKNAHEVLRRDVESI